MNKLISKIKCLLNAMCFTMFSLMPSISNAQSKLEIKDFNEAYTFTSTYTIDLKTNSHSETITDFTAIAKFNIDKNGEGTIDFTTLGVKSTSVLVNYSQIKNFNQKTYWNFGCTHSERPEKIQITLEINQGSNKIESLTIFNEGKENAYVFY